MLRTHTLLIDANYFCYSRLFVLPRPKIKDAVYMDTEREMDIYMRKLATDFASEMRKFQNITKRVVFALDDKSWRKDLYPEANYKGNREYSSDINWNNVHKIIDEFVNIIKDSGVIVDKVSGAEGDDLIFAWTTHLNSIDENCIIWTGDKDLIQLVNYNKSTNSYTIWYDDTRSLAYVYPGFNHWLNTKDSESNINDIFSMDSAFFISDQVKLELKQILSRVKVNEVYCDEYVLRKLLIGDRSDNIKSVYSYYKKDKNGKLKEYRVTKRMASSVLDEFKKKYKRFSSIYLFDDDYKYEIAKLVAHQFKSSSKSKIEDIKENLTTNTNLALLHVSTIPDAIQKSMFDQIKIDLKTNLGIKYNQITSKDKILNNTKFIESDFNPNKLF